MSDSDVDRIIGRMARKLFWMLVVPVLAILISAKVIDIRVENKRAAGHYLELYRLTAELSTTQAMYIKANDEDKVELGKRMDNIINRMDRFADHDVFRGMVFDERPKRKYGLEFTSLL